MIRITVERAGTGITIKEFTDSQEAGLWWVNGANISDPDVVRFVWEKLGEDGCAHRWTYGSSTIESFWVGCGLCLKTVKFSQEDITDLAKARGQM